MLQEVRWSCINGERNGRDGGTQMKVVAGVGRQEGRATAVGKVLTELINELALRDKA